MLVLRCNFTTLMRYMQLDALAVQKFLKVTKHNVVKSLKYFGIIPNKSCLCRRTTKATVIRGFVLANCINSQRTAGRGNLSHTRCAVVTICGIGLQNCLGQLHGFLVTLCN